MACSAPFGQGSLFFQRLFRVSTRLLISLLLLSLPICLASCNFGAEPTGAEPPDMTADLAPHAVRVVAPQRGAIRQQLRYMGTVHAQQDVQILARASATISEIFVDEGDLVTVDTPLIRRDAPELDAQIRRLGAEVARIRTDRDFNCQTYERERELAAAGVLPRVQAEASQARCMASDEGLRAAQEALGEANERRGFLDEVSPVDGVVLQRLVEVGEYAVAGRPLFLIGSGEVEARVSVAESDIRAGLQVGSPAVVRTSHGEEPATIISIAPQARGMGRTVEVRLTLPPTMEEERRPGMSVDVAFILAESTEAVTVPDEAVLDSDEGAYVFVVEGDRLRKVAVETGIRADGRVEIVEMDLDSRVVIGSLRGLADGDVVYAVEPGR